MNNLETLAAAAGIAAAYHDIWGNTHTVPHATLRHLLAMLGLPAHDDAAIEASIEKCSRDAARSLDHIILAGEHRKTRIPAPEALSWTLIDEAGAEIAGEAQHGEIALPPCDSGYYRLRVALRGGDAIESCLIVAPPTCWQPPKMTAGQKMWGLALQLYGLRSATNCGIGDFGDLAVVTEKAAAFGADLIGINPPTAPFLNNPGQYSPYSPSNRLLLNPLYIDVTAIDGFADDEEVQRVWNTPEFQIILTGARQADLVDYSAVTHIKQSLFQPLYARFLQQDRHEKFDAFCQRGGETVRRGALFEALHEHFNHAETRLTFWREWPEPFRRPDSAEVQAFADANSERIGFYMWLQWLCERQLAHAQSMALEKGMAIGLYRDLAVGCEGSSAEAWQQPDAFLDGASIGAPPDELNPGGQGWGLLPLDPRCLRETGYAAFIALLRANMAQARALRIDHAFGLARLFLIPHHASPRDGAYLSYPLAELLAVLRIESHRNQCLVIGEDLGTMPHGFRDAVAASGLLSYKILYFERDATGAFLPPHRYAPLSLAAISTHDLATLQGWWQARDLAEKETLAVYPSDEARWRERNGRDRDRPLLQEALRRENLSDNDLTWSVHRYLARSAAALCMVQLEDILGLETQANLPGTTNERPNWRMRMPQMLDKIMAPGGPFAQLAPLLTTERAAPERDCPRATYRLQFHKGFTFYDAAKIIPYLATLGVSHVYASPWLKSRPGSLHGYDITDHNAFNPELGGEDGYRTFITALQQYGLRQILDFVPNHMGVGGSDNHWWLSTLEWGRLSPFAAYFDINWHAGRATEDGKLIVPVLGSPYGDTLATDELDLRFDSAEGSISLWYHEHRFPLCPATYDAVFSDLTAADVEAGERLKVALRDDRRRHPDIETRIRALAADKSALHALLERQSYRLAYWRVASSEINYRRFFDIHDLAGLRMERSEVFDATHALVCREIEAGHIHGLRIDHIDGLADPEAYCRHLRARTGARLYLVVEKILEAHETLTTTWPIEGTTGYDQLNLIAGVLIETRNENAFDRLYRQFTGLWTPFDQIVAEAKTATLETTLLSELLRLSFDLRAIAASSAYTRDYPLEMLETALKDILAWFPIYRTYVTQTAFTPEDRRAIVWATDKARKESQLPELAVYDYIASLLSLETIGHPSTHLNFVRRFQQLSGPAMAKGFEDTAFYRFHRLLALNEVGGNPARFGIDLKAFHQTQQKRAAQWPHAMSATATHDTKRGEDMRARLCALSGMPAEWQQFLDRAHELNRRAHSEIDGATAPSDNEAYFIYQTLLGSWPLELLTEPFDDAAYAAYRERLAAYLQKALREAKRHTSWNNPHEDYEKAAQTFLDQILTPTAANLFLKELLTLAQSIAVQGLLASLSQCILKFTLPGVPDIYQGTEFWDFSLVDPDNRRPVDYAARDAALADAPPPLAMPPADQLITEWRDGRIKQHITRRLLAHRSANADLYRCGSYHPIDLTGAAASQFLAFARRHQNQELIIVVPIRFTGWQPNKPIDLSFAGIDSEDNLFKDILSATPVDIAALIDLAKLPFRVFERKKPMD